MKLVKALTLVELLIASSIFVVVMVTIYSAFHSGIFGYRNIEETLDVYQTARSILGRINLDLRNSFAYSEDETKFVGEKNKISFLTLVDTYRQDKIVQDYAFVFYGIGKYKTFLTTENQLKVIAKRFSCKLGDDNKLMRLCRKNQEALKEDSEIQPEEMADNVEKLNFTYFYFDTADSKLKEKDSWDHPKNLPVAVKVSLTIKAKIEQKFERTIYLPLAKVK